MGRFHLLSRYREIKLKIKKWYENESSKIKLQSKIDVLQDSENVRIYHHEIQQKNIKRSPILKLQTEQGLIESHFKCADYLEKSVSSLLLFPPNLYPSAQARLLNEVKPVFTEEDNRMLLTPPSQEEVKEVLWSCNLNASPGTDGISALLYKVHWDILGKYLSSIVNKVFSGQQPSNSQQTILMIFANKPKKPNSIQAKDKSRISLLNVDFKLMTGMEAKRMRKTMNHTVSVYHLCN